jgi:glycosyltransferase involved in cell wall biosynthesis
MPRVSIVVPNYNYGRFLAQRMRSLVEQSFRDVEILYLDDCSTDDSEAVIAPFLDDPRVRAVRNAENSGNAFKQFNKGARLAQGEYLWVAQADDYAELDFLETLVPLMDANPSVGLAYSQSLAVDDDGQVLHSMSRRTDELDRDRWQHDHVNDGRDEIRDYLLLKNTIPNASAVLFRRDALESAGFADESLRLAPDHLTYVNLLLLSDVAYVARPLNYFRHHTSTIRKQSRNDGLQISEGYQVLSHIRERLELSDADLEPALSRLARKWLKSSWRGTDRIALSAQPQILRQALASDSRLAGRLLQMGIAKLTR